MQEGGRKYCITEVYPVLILWWVVYAILLLCWSTTCFITLVSFTQLFLHCWTTPNHNTLFRYTLFYYIAEQFSISITTGPYPIPTHCWGIPYLITLLSNSQILIHCWAIPNPNILLMYTQLWNIAEVNPNSIHYRVIPNPNTSLRYIK